MISVRAASVRLGNVQVVDGMDLEVGRGGWTMLIGRNGAGKSTLLRAVAGLVPYTGSVTVGGVELRALRTRERARTVAMVPQNPLLPADMTVAEYVLLSRAPHLGFLGRPGRRDHNAVRQAVDRLDLDALATRRLDALSGGERQRAVLARALAQNAPVMLLDEPTSALDVGRQQEVLDLVSGLRAERELTVLGATHDLTLAGHYADRLVLVDGGHVVTDGTPDEVLTEERINRHYDARVRVRHIDGVPVVFPAGAAVPHPAGQEVAS